MADGLAARAAALAALNAVLGEGLMLSEIPEPALPPQDRARARRLADEVLRRIEPADRLLDKLLRKSPPLALRNILRLGVVEMALGAAPHGVVNAAVALARQNMKTRHMSGLVNAVLRGVDPAQLLAAPVQKMPRWLRQPLVHAWGREAVQAMETVFAAAPPLDLTLKDNAAGDLPEGLRLATGSLRLTDPGRISGLPGYEAGHWWVQDMAAAMPARLLDAKPGERVLDLCAAPGGKTMQLAASGADVTALDISPARMRRVEENLARTGLQAQLVTADALHWQPEEKFDAILLDAPCSASGTIRRHPDLPYLGDGSEIAGLAALQSALIDRALEWLVPGGRLVFATCSLFPEEGEMQMDAALERHPGLTPEQPDLPGIDPAWWLRPGGLRLRPDYLADQGGMDGFFMMRLRKA
ncbi:methyltransferase domain-containing protein [Xinfangfangia sp. D13-10-4-6]|uniref:RsmB/NOP family class I SAM-dependent RNA methyltransferase n=1 Tax=Pseudogemmobacter hezensis TaxID=2737662 RepID=UPI00155693D7|nr:transcription antitermination factor NusB [Pseudogemmobacter hezensis]NPD13991.1 methyltransferase domain-containing protein [Pseudogemmobacter hezensis]